MILSDLADLKKVVPTNDEVPGDDPIEGFELIGTLSPEMGAVHILVIRAAKERDAAEAELEACQEKTLPEELISRVALSRSLFDTYRAVFQHILFEKFGKKVAGRPVQVCRGWHIAIGKPVVPQMFFAVEVVRSKGGGNESQGFPFAQKPGEA